MFSPLGHYLRTITSGGMAVSRTIDTAQRALPGPRTILAPISWGTAFTPLASTGSSRAPPGSKNLLLDPSFLAIGTLLGITCGHSYVVQNLCGRAL